MLIVLPVFVLLVAGMFVATMLAAVRADLREQATGH
ncbi:uncharacterized protein HemY [Mycoplana sp. BE70]|nr:uncharacterized protein HemY [Mycoplana sp. BE70]